MKCKFGVGCGPDGGMFRCDTRRELAEHTLTVHADYLAERPEAKAAWEKDLEWSKMVERFAT